MKYYIFVFITIYGFALGREPVNFENPQYFMVDEPKEQKATSSWLGQQDHVQEVEDSCDMRGRACHTYFYWKGCAFWLLEGNVNQGSLITLLEVIELANRSLTQLIFIDEDYNIIKESLYLIKIMIFL